jgi:hypothetical protein
MDWQTLRGQRVATGFPRPRVQRKNQDRWKPAPLPVALSTKGRWGFGRAIFLRDFSCNMGAEKAWFHRQNRTESAAALWKNGFKIYPAMFVIKNKVLEP